MADAGRWLLILGLVSAAGALVTARRNLLLLAAAALGGAAAALGWALVTHDFSLAYVAATSRRGAPWWYRTSALWGGPEGSLLVFALVLAVVAALAASDAGSRPRRVLGAAVASVGAAALLLADPFARAALPPIDGLGLAPILEHPAMAVHPPLLYAGLAATLPPFAWAVAGRTADGTGAASARSWLLAAVSLLTVAMALGGLWSYVEAGWGGYWAWDPVENTSLAPWLAALVALHAARAGWGRAWLDALPFVLVLAGAALTRGGVTPSVHAFAEDRALGWWFGGLAAVAVAAVAVGEARRRRAQGRDDGAAIGAVLSGAALVVVVVGTAAPMIRQALGDQGTAVGGWFFARLVGPLAAVGVVAMAWLGLRRRSAVGLALALLAGLAAAGTAWAGGWPLNGVALAGLGALGVVGSLAGLVERRHPAWLAHAGVALALVGVAGTVATTSATVTLGPGEATAVAGVAVRLERIEVADPPDQGSSGSSEERPSVQAVLTATDGGSVRGLVPALVAHRDGVLAETALWSRPWRDVQAVLVRADDGGRALVELRVRPLVHAVWWGAVLITLGAGLSAIASRRRAAARAVSDGRACAAAARSPS